MLIESGVHSDARFVSRPGKPKAMTDTVLDLPALVDASRSEIAACESLDDLEQIRVRLLGKKGSVTELLKSLGAMDPEARRTAGAKINEAKQTLTAALEARRAELEAAK